MSELLKKADSKEAWKERVPEIDWDAPATRITSKINVDNDAVALSEEPIKNERKGWLTTFAGCDIVAMANGRVIGELQKLEYELDGDMKGEITLTNALFEEATLTKFADTFVVLAYANEYGATSYQILKLDKMKKYISYASVDTIIGKEKAVYEGEVLVPLTKVPENIRFMSDEVFSDMIDKVYSGCSEKRYLPEKQPTRNNLINRMYFYYLYKNYCVSEES